MTARRALFLLGALLAAACSDSTGLPGALDGTWSHFDHLYPGLGYNMTLATQGNTVAGTGQWYGEACCAGPLAVSGTVAGNAVLLDLTFTATSGGLQPPFTQHFEGRLVRRDSLAGTLTANGESMPTGYFRTQ